MSGPSLRALLGTVAVAVVLWPTSAASVHAVAVAPPRFKAIAFDYFVLFNPDSVVTTVERIFPGKGRISSLGPTPVRPCAP